MYFGVLNAPVIAQSAASASFVGTDTATQGNWKGRYGADGYSVSQDPSAGNPALPAYATVRLSGSSFPYGDYTWAATTADPRAPLKAAPGADRLAACWYSNGSDNSFDVDVSLTDGQAHRVSLYGLDWYRNGRREVITVRDAATGAALDAQAVGAALGGGAYLTWAVRGHVVFHVASSFPSGGLNAVLSGLFFDPEGPPAAPVQVLAVNAGGGTARPFAADAYVQGGSTYAVGTAIDTSAVSSPAPQAVYQSERWGASTYTLPGLVPGAAYTLRLHFAEIFYSAAGQRQFNVSVNGAQVLTNFDIVAAAGGANKAVAESFPATANGSGQIVVQFNYGAADNPKVSGLEVLGTPPAGPAGLMATAGDASVSLSWTAAPGATSYSVYRGTASGAETLLTSGLTAATFTDAGLTNGTAYYYQVTAANGSSAGAKSSEASAVPAAPSSTATAVFVGADAVTQGNWKGTYGTDGYSVSQDAARLPAYAAVGLGGSSNYVWAGSTPDPRAPLKSAPGGADRLAACWYSPQYAGGGFDVDVNLTDGQAHRISLYCLDWDGRGRVDAVTVRDASTGAALDSQTLPAFSGGVYLTWTVKGHVAFHVASPNDFAVLSALFFDSGQGATTPAVTGVSISPPAATVSGSQAQQFVATVSGTRSPAQTIIWASSAGTITGAGVLTAPAATASVQTVTVTATSTADSTKSATATVTVPALSPVSASGTGKIRYFPRAGCAPRMLGGRFQGSADGVSYVDLFTITISPADGQWTEAASTTDPKTYRYLRYLSPNGSWGNIAEVEFYSVADTGAVKLTGTPFGTPGSYNNAGATFAKVFDGDAATYFDGPGPDGNFVGFDRGNPLVTVTAVAITPPAVTMAGGRTQQFSAAVTGTGGPAQTVIWSASAGTITAAGLFTAPAALGFAQAVVVTATSTDDGSKNVSAIVTIPAVMGGALRIGFLGDSITYGIGGGGGPGCYDWALTGLSQNGYQVAGVNYGHPGASVTSFYQQTAGPIQAFKAADVNVVSLMLGTNDATFVQTSPQDYHDKLLWIVTSLLAPGTGIQKVILNYSPYIQATSTPQWDAGVDGRLQVFQAQIDSLCNGTTILQGDKLAFPFFQQHLEQDDGIHPNRQGHQDLGRLWAIGITNALGGTNTLTSGI